jgi:hypothetical protein
MSSFVIPNLQQFDIIPSSVTHLTFGYCFNQKVEALDLKNMTHLTFGDLFNQSVEALDLKVVTDLTFGCHFNQRVETLDLKSVAHLTFEYFFNQRVETLDLKSVTHLTFGCYFNQIVETLDLKGVTHLTFGYYFNQPVEALDLKGVTHLTFGQSFNYDLQESLFVDHHIKLSDNYYQNPTRLLLSQIRNRQLPIFSGSNVYNQECPICLDPLTAVDIVLSCGHAFCVDCMLVQIRVSVKTCGYCRAENVQYFQFN